jgi:ABC-2 type transport system permease protein
MNLRGGFALIRSTWASWMQYRSFFFLLAFGWMIPPLIYLFVWSSAAGDSDVGGFTRAQFAGYYLVLILVNQITYSQTNWTVGDVIRDGTINRWILQPMAPVFHPLSSELAGKVVYMVFVIPVALVLAVVLKPDIQTTPLQFLLFLVALTMSWLLRFLWGFWLALLAFWATRADALLAVQDSLIFLLAGMVAPLSLLPPALRMVAQVLPFRFMLSFPIEVLIGQVQGKDLAVGFLLQAAWLGLAFLLSMAVWRAGIRQYTAVGG